MDADPTLGGGGAEGSEVMAAVDEDRFLVADVSRDDAWLSIASTEAVEVSAYR